MLVTLPGLPNELRPIFTFYETCAVRTYLRAVYLS